MNDADLEFLRCYERPTGIDAYIAAVLGILDPPCYTTTTALDLCRAAEGEI